MRKKCKRLLALILSFCCIFSMCASPLTAYAEPGSGETATYGNIDFQGDGGTFTVTTSWDTWETEGMRTGFTVGTSMADNGWSVTDPVYWTPRDFAGWKLCTMEQIIHEDGGFHYEYVQVEGTDLFTTAEALAYPVEERDLYFWAVWAGNDDDYNTQVYINTYGGEMKAYNIQYENNEQVKTERTSGSYGFYLKENGQGIATQVDWWEFAFEPTRDGSVFEGWIEFKVIETADGETRERVSDTIYTMAEMLAKPVPEYTVEYVAKWDNIELDNYFIGGPGNGGGNEDPGNVGSIDFQGNQGTFTVTTARETWETNGMRASFALGTSFADNGWSVTDPVFGDTGREFLGWMLCTLEEFTNDDGGTYWDYMQVEGTELFTTEEALAYPVEETPLYFYAQWEGEDDDYMSQVNLNTFDGQMKAYQIRWENGEEIRTEVTNEGYGFYLLEGNDSMATQLSWWDFAFDPTKDGAEFEGWIEFKEVRTDHGRTYERVADTLYTTAEVLAKPIPEYNVLYAAKWDNMSLDEYFGGGNGGSGDDGGEVQKFIIRLEGNGGEFTITIGKDVKTGEGWGNRAAIGTSLGDRGFSLQDPVYWDPERQFLGWMACVWETITNEDGSTYRELVQIEGTELMTSDEVLAYVIPDYDTYFYAQWAGDEDDYNSQIYMDTYGGQMKAYRISWENDEEIKTEDTSGRYNFYLKENGQGIAEQVDWWEFAFDPTRDGAEFEGWIEFKVSNTENGTVYERVSDTLYTTAAMLAKPIPEYTVSYTAKWDNIPLDNYYNGGSGGSGGGNTGDDDPNVVVVEIDGNEGMFTVANGDGTRETDFFGYGYIPGWTLARMEVTITDPVYWDSTCTFEGWQLCHFVEQTDVEGNSFEMCVPVEGVDIMTTAEMLKYTIPNEKIRFTAQWSGDYYDYHSDVFVSGYDTMFTFQVTNWEDGQAIVDEITGTTWGNVFRENGQTLEEQVDGAFTIPADPTKEGATFEGWAAFKVENGNYTLLSNTLYTTEQIFDFVVPEYDLMFAAKWSDIAIEDYYKNTGGGNDSEYDYLIINTFGGNAVFTQTIDGVNVTEEGDIIEFEIKGEFVSLTVDRQCSTFDSWTAYSYDEIGTDVVNAGEEPNLSGPAAIVRYAWTEVDEYGIEKDIYVVLWGGVAYENLTTEEFYDLPGGSDYYVEVNWTDNHTAGEAVMKNIVDATETANGSYDSVVYCTECGQEMSRTTETITITSQDTIVEGSDLEFRVDTKDAITEVPKAVESTYETIEDIIKALKDIAQNIIGAVTEAVTEVLDAELKVKEADGTWVTVDDTNFPAGGVSLLLPYPNGTNRAGYDFVVTHVITSGTRAGEVEVLDAVEEAEGLRVVVTSLSPIGITYTEDTTTGYTVSGTVTSFLDNSEVTISLAPANGDPVYNCTTTDGSYSIPEVEDGTYTMTVSKANHVTRTYEITVAGGDLTQDVVIWLLGDITGDGEISIRDYVKVLSVAKGISTFEGYGKACADINGDDRISVADYAKILVHAKGVSKLW